MLYEIFVYLQKYYDALGQGHALKILEGYRMDPRVCQLLNQYWDWATMETRERGYYGHPFQGSCGVSQGHTISPWIFNVIVDAILCHCVGTLAKNEDSSEGFEYAVAKNMEFIYMWTKDSFPPPTQCV